MRKFRLLAAALLASIALPSLAQDVQTGPDMGSGEGEEGAQRSVPKVEVGAGTTSGVTTDSSGPPEDGGQSADVVQVPPLPGEELCQDYQSAVRQDCLAKVLRQPQEGKP